MTEQVQDAAADLTGPGVLSGPATESAQGRRFSLRSSAILIPFLVLFIALSISSPNFLTPLNLLNLLDQQSATLIIAAAGTLVLISGGLDLSVGATYALAAVVSGQLAASHGPVAGAVAGLAVGMAVGLVNGVVSTVLRINSLIATLAMSFVVAGIASLVTGGNLVVLFDKLDFAAIARTKVIGIRTSVWIMVIVIVVLGIVLARTTYGRYVYAVGGNAQASLLAGIRVHGVRILAFTLSGTAAAAGGIIDTSRVLSAQASPGTTLTFTVLAGIVVGGTSILGGEGAIWRTVVGVLFIALVGNGFNLLGVDALFQQITLGAILLLAVGIDAWTRYLRQ